MLMSRGVAGGRGGSRGLRGARGAGGGWGGAAGGRRGSPGVGGDGVPTTLPSGQSPGPSDPGTKYPVRGQSLTSIIRPPHRG